MATITPSNATTQLLIRLVGDSAYSALKLPSDQVTMDDAFFQSKSVNDVMPQIYIDECPILYHDIDGFCTWEIKDDPENNIYVTNKAMVLNVRNSSGNTVITASDLVTYGTEPDATYSLNIYLRSDSDIAAGTYTAVIQL